MIGTKKSTFTKVTEVPASASFDFTSGGTNYGIDYQYLLTSLGATGTITQSGSVDDFPVLDKQGSINGIRNLKEGPGISLNITPQNSLEISTSVDFDETGIPLVDDPESPELAYRSIVQGKDMIITSPSPGQILIALDEGTVLPSNVVIVNDLSDFPDPIGNVITLTEPNAVYIFSSGVQMGLNRIIAGPNNVFQGFNISQDPINYTGTLPFVTINNTNFKTNSLSYNTPNSTTFLHTGTGFDRFTASDVEVENCVKAIDLNQVTYIIDTTAVFNCTDGLSVTGTNIVIGSISKTFFGATSGTCVDLGVSTHLDLEFSDVIFNTAGTAIDGAPASANMVAGGICTVTGCNFSGAATPLAGLSEDDIRYRYTGNTVIPDTYPDAMVSLSSNATPTVLAAGVPALVLGTWVEERASQFSTTAAGRCTWLGELSLISPITVSADVVPVSGTNKDITLCIAINGVLQTNGCRTVRVDNGNPVSVTLVWQYDLQPNDYTEIYVSSADGTDVTVNAVIRIR